MTEKSSAGSKVYFKNLDSLRGLAALAVLFYHLALWIPAPDTETFFKIKMLLSYAGSGGMYGVNFFFVLSGFLITFLMFDEKETKGSIDVRNFYLRRILRIWPLYYTTLLIGFFIWPSGNDFRHLLYYVFFAVNIDLISHATPSNSMLGVQWSLAAEEQFYLIWPLLMLLVKRPKILAGIFLTLTCLSEYFFQKQTVWEMGYYHPLCTLRFQTFGALLAYLVFYHKQRLDKITARIPLLLSAGVYAVCFYLLYNRQEIGTHGILLRYGLELLPMFFFGFVLLQQILSNKSILESGSLNFLLKTGKISFGLYLLHMPAIQICTYFIRVTDGIGFLTVCCCAVLLTFVLSLISFRLLEKPFLLMKERLSFKPIS